MSAWLGGEATAQLYPGSVGADTPCTAVRGCPGRGGVAGPGGQAALWWDWRLMEVCGCWRWDMGCSSYRRGPGWLWGLSWFPKSGYQ